MKYAENVLNIINAFKASPLEGDELNNFYCDGTMQFRTGDKYSSPILNIGDACKQPSERNAFLLMGHKGCGKSTELNNMTRYLRDEGYQISTIKCGQDLDLNNIVHTDLLILLGETLLNIANEINCELDSTLMKSIEQFWITEISETKATTNDAAISLETGIGIGLSGILTAFSKIKGDLKFSESKRTEYKTKIKQRTGEWIIMINQISDEIATKLNGKQPIVIFEDLDKINASTAWEIFGNYTVLLTSVSFPIIYTFPIALSYDPRFAALDAYFNTETLPMIKLKTIDGDLFQPGIDIIIEIVRKRTKISLFESGVLEVLIEKTGGSLRDLFYAINTAAQRAVRRSSDTISREDINRALEELKTSLTRRIEEKYHAFLMKINNGERQIISDKVMLLEMLQANAVLEYNGIRWHNVHPLIADYLLSLETTTHD